MKEYITKSSLQTKKLAMELAGSFKGGEIICLSGDLGAGKTTFTQGLLKGLKIKGPYTSPTFAIMKHYQITTNDLPRKKSSVVSRKLSAIYHIDAYRINSKDLLDLGFKDFAGKPDTVTIIEWPEKVKKLIPTEAVRISFHWLSDKERKIVIVR